jgi:hypothetical protein
MDQRVTAASKTPAAIAKWKSTRQARQAPVAEFLEAKSIPEPNSGCLLWTGATNSHGYGIFTRNCQNFYAHRVALELASRALQKGECACHRCDNPYCINPEHLFIGSHADNMRDATRKGRLRFVNAPRGESHHSAKLNAEKAAAIRLEIQGGATMASLARAYGVSASSVAAIRDGKSWKNAGRQARRSE